jgi:5,10-methylenetetrahydrofolate reductase
MFGNHPKSKNVFDLDSMQLLQMVKAMRDEKRFDCGEEMEGQEPRFFIGAAANPFADPFEYRPHRLAKKVAAGADFIQTQIIFNVPKFAEFMKRVCDLGLHEKVYILAGVSPVKTLGAARYMAKFVPGMDVPDEIVTRMKESPKEKREEEGIKICVEVIQQVREIPGVAGIHLMAIEWEEAVPEITERAGLLPRPQV